jgi:putative sigma-54 modulation protein
MIEKIEISGVHSVVTADLQKYVMRKIGKLDRYMPKNARESAHAEVLLKEGKAKNKNRCTCEVILHLPHEVIATKESTMNMFAAVDIVEAKLRNQIKKYKDTHTANRFSRRVITRFTRGQ